MKAVAALVLTALLVAGCGSSHSAKVAPHPVPPAAGCVTDEQAHAGGFSVGVGGQLTVHGVVLGGGATGVLLANESDGDLCQWQPYGLELARKGYRVALFNYSGTDSPPDILAAAKVLHDHGAHKLFLVGASMGGTGVLHAAAEMQPPAAGVVDLSGPESYAGANGLAAVRKLTVPTLFIAGQFDSPFVDNTREMYAASAATDKKLVVQPSGNHGIALVDDQVGALIETFLGSH
jgi:pimeloyl-ACP methyl ester carboxylesterase